MKLRNVLALIVFVLCAAAFAAAQGELPPPPGYPPDHAQQTAPPPAQSPAQSPASPTEQPLPLPSQTPSTQAPASPSQQPLPLPLPAAAQTQTQTAPGQTQGSPQIESQIDLGGSAPAGKEPSLQPNPLQVLRGFEPGANEEYRLGKGDAITVDFAGRPDLQAKLIVGPDGRITLPLAGDITLDGLTRLGAAQAIEKALAPYYSNLVATVTVTAYTANRVVLLGAVDRPGTITFDGTPTLLEALARGGVEAGPDKSGEMPQRNEIPERCAIYRGNDQVIWVELRKLVESGNSLADLRLHRDDVIYVPSNSERFISVLGQVKNPGAIQLSYSATLASVIASAGGFADGAGRKPHIEIVDPSTGTKHIYTFEQMMNPVEASEIQLKPGEIVFVPQTGFYRATYVLERLSPLVTLAAVFAYAGEL